MTMLTILAVDLGVMGVPSSFADSMKPSVNVSIHSLAFFCVFRHCVNIHASVSCGS